MVSLAEHGLPASNATAEHITEMQRVHGYYSLEDHGLGTLPSSENPLMGRQQVIAGHIGETALPGVYIGEQQVTVPPAQELPPQPEKSYPN